MKTDHMTQVIDSLGGTSKVARLCQVAPQAVSNWRRKGFIPQARLQFLQAMYPHLFGLRRHNGKLIEIKQDQAQ